MFSCGIILEEDLFVYYIDECNSALYFYNKINEWLQEHFCFYSDSILAMDDYSIFDDFIYFEFREYTK